MVFSEDSRVKIPCILHLVRLGYRYLLRVIFDDGLHWNLGRDNTIPIVAKLGNPIIKKLIIELVPKSLGGSDAGGAPA